ncbi:Two-component response regulator SSK1p [Malassezia furfur]|uniref:Two-component response regulator SSK1p n=1 Tax=Malassezia furfur TaxID=55194 RepID=A0ABY8EWW8_MALFU|nr:Two-component response regulator SSK1p [Malassezia furfur]
MLASQKAYEVLSQTLLECIEATLQALWQPLSAQLRVSVSSPSLQAVVHTTVALQWLGPWLSQSVAPTAIPIPEAPVSSSSHVEDLVQIAADVVVMRAVANRVQLYVPPPTMVEAAADATALLQDAPGEMSLPWFPSAYYGIAMHTILVHILSWVVRLSKQDSRVIMLPVSHSHSSDARIDLFFDATVQLDESAWPAWLGPQAHLQHVLDELGVSTTQAPLTADERATLPILAPLGDAKNPTYLQIALRRPRSIDLISSVPASVADGTPSLVRLVHALPLQAMVPHLPNKRVRIFPWGPQKDHRCLQLQACLVDLGCDVDIFRPDRMPQQGASAPTSANATPDDALGPPSGSGGATATSPAPGTTSPAGAASPDTVVPSASTLHAVLNGLPHPQAAEMFSEHFLQSVEVEGRELDLIIVHNNPSVLYGLLAAHVHAPIIYFAPPAALARMANGVDDTRVVFLPVPVGYVRLLWAIFSAWFVYDSASMTYRSRNGDGTELPATAPPSLPSGKEPHTPHAPPPAATRSASSDGETSAAATPSEPLVRPTATRESSGASLTDLMDAHADEDDAVVASATATHKVDVASTPAIPPLDLKTGQTGAGADADAAAAADAADAAARPPPSPETVVGDSFPTPMQRVQEPPDYFTKAVSQLATQPTNSGLVIRSVDGRAAGIFFQPPAETLAADGAAAAGADAAAAGADAAGAGADGTSGAPVTPDVGDASGTLGSARGSVPDLPDLVAKEADHEASFDLSVPPSPLPPHARPLAAASSVPPLSLHTDVGGAAGAPSGASATASASASAADTPSSSRSHASSATELSLSNTTFRAEPVADALNVTDPARGGEPLFATGHVLKPVGFETLLGLDTPDVSPGAPSTTVPVAPAPAPSAAAPTVVPPSLHVDIERSVALERPPSMVRPGAPHSIELPPPPPIPSQAASESVKGQPTPYSHLSSKLKRTSAQPQSGMLIGGHSHVREPASGGTTPAGTSAASVAHPPVYAQVPHVAVPSTSSVMAAATPGRVSPTVAARIQRRKLALRDDFLPPVKVLIVEDNVINQRILSTFLRKRQIKYEVAKDGREAIDKWRQGDFHLILMDIQLPVLNGIEATKEIRRLECEARSHTHGDDVPPPMSPAARHSVIIVALTASVLSSDRVEALAAGCNDFLNKPVSLPWLQRKILEWGSMQYLLHAGRAARAVAPGAPVTTPPTPGAPAAGAAHVAPPPPAGGARPPARQRGSFDRVVNEKAQQVATRLHLSPPRAPRTPPRTTRMKENKSDV